MAGIPSSQLEVTARRKRFLQLELLGASEGEICEQLGISERTYWRDKSKVEEDIKAKYLYQQWRLVITWWQRQQEVYREYSTAYADSRNLASKDSSGKTKPDYSLLDKMKEIENEVLDRLIKLGLVFSKESPGVNPSSASVGMSLAELIQRKSHDFEANKAQGTSLVQGP